MPLRGQRILVRLIRLKILSTAPDPIRQQGGPVYDDDIKVINSSFDKYACYAAELEKPHQHPQINL